MFYNTLLKINLKRKGQVIIYYTFTECGIYYKAKIGYLNSDNCELLF
jgi:hypothetical protein